MSDTEVLKPDKVYINLDDSIVDSIVDDYIATLRDEELIYSQKGNAFTGLIKKLHKRLNITRDIYADIDQLNDLWEVYTDLCYRFNQNPTLMEYAILVGCSRDTIYSWMNGEVKTSDICHKLGSSRSDTVQKWANECRMGRYKSAAAGNVGGIFLCKAVDGMAETAPVQIEPERRKSVDQIRQERGLELHENDTQLPPPDAPIAPDA